MEGVQLILENGPSLTEQEKLEIVNLGWLFTHVPERVRAEAMTRISPLLGSKDVDRQVYMTAVREIAVSLQNALDEQIERIHSAYQPSLEASEVSMKGSPLD